MAFIGILLISIATSAFAGPAESFRQNWNFEKPCDTRCPRALFDYLAQLYRPTGGEAATRDFILSVVEESRKHWPQPLAPGLTATPESESGNLLVRVPGTGAFAKAKPVALQGHMDMVLSAREAKPGEDLKKYFENGVSLEEKDGWLQSKDQKTTLGADNGIGVAMALRYVVDSRIPHPPLELVFTTSEEVGLRGASLFRLPLRAEVMVNVDGMVPGDGTPGIVYGSVGSNRTVVAGSFAAETRPANSQLLQVEVRGLRGGHSGADIHRPRLNAVKALAQLGEFIFQTYPDSRIQSAISNSENGINQIPGAFGATFAIVTGEAPESVRLKAIRFIQALVAKHADEDPDKVQVSVQSPVTGSEVLSREASQKVIAALLKAPSGLTHSDPQFPNGMRTSSNLGYVSLAPAVGSASALTLRAAFMTRSYAESEMDQVVEQSSQALAAAWSGGAAPTVTKLAGYGPWLADRDSALMRKLLREVPYFKTTYLLAVGLEPSYFKKTYPKLEIFAVAPDIRDAHSPSERVKIQSVYEVTEALDQVLRAL